MPFLPLPPRTVGAWGKRDVSEFHTRGGHPALCCRLISSFYIKPQHSVSEYGPRTYCLILSFYIKPQLCLYLQRDFENCLISSFYIKPQRKFVFGKGTQNCLISSFYIKPQLSETKIIRFQIVLYRLSTSNHNTGIISDTFREIVLYRLSTSNHNFAMILLVSS